ncbi:hypothetical protein SAMN05428975_3124 [Mucilaginibacter sp. OK268]|nr:hypothetical protein SAMN05428975_3124 [Mucilaginibacter sp. OK268]
MADKETVDIIDSENVRTMVPSYHINLIYNFIFFIFLICLGFFWGTSILVLALILLLLS